MGSLFHQVMRSLFLHPSPWRLMARCSSPSWQVCSGLCLQRAVPRVSASVLLLPYRFLFGVCSVYLIRRRRPARGALTSRRSHGIVTAAAQLPSHYAAAVLSGVAYAHQRPRLLCLSARFSALAHASEPATAPDAFTRFVCLRVAMTCGGCLGLAVSSIANEHKTRAHRPPVGPSLALLPLFGSTPHSTRRASSPCPASLEPCIADCLSPTCRKEV